MGIQKIVGIVLLVAGIVLLVLSLIADMVGIGTGGFGTRQILGAVAGAIAAIVGMALIPKKKK